jgi:hypothetical protein
MTKPADHPNYDPWIVALPMLEEVAELHPRCLTAHELSRRMVDDPKDRKEVQAFIGAICSLKRSGLFCVENDDWRITPTDAALVAVALLTEIIGRPRIAEETSVFSLVVDACRSPG